MMDEQQFQDMQARIDRLEERLPPEANERPGTWQDLFVQRVSSGWPGMGGRSFAICLWRALSLWEDIKGKSRTGGMAP